MSSLRFVFFVRLQEDFFVRLTGIWSLDVCVCVAGKWGCVSSGTEIVADCQFTTAGALSTMENAARPCVFVCFYVCVFEMKQ